MDMTPIDPATLAVSRLSRRQVECLNLASEGRTSKEIARAIGLSPSTVDNHIRSAIERLGARNRADAIRMLRDSQTPVTAAPSAPPLLEVGDIEHQPSLPVGRFPPLGGQINMLPVSRRLMMVLQITAASVMVGAAVIVTISGVVHLLR